MSEPDYYDREVARLTELARDNPFKLFESWARGKGLFRFASKSGLSEHGIGCLTMVRNGDCYTKAATPELTAAIRADARIPDSARAITVEHLPVFAEWQRRLDAELGRTVPA